MIAYSTLKGLVIPEGAVKQITDSLGRVLWSAKPSEATVTITGEGSSSTAVERKIACVTIDGVDYTSATNVAVPVGTIVACTVSTMSTYHLDEGWVKVNGVTVLTASEGNSVTYNYTVNGNVTINMLVERNEDKDRNGYITIAEQ